tara:strand:+ start:1807 stop:1956 length:150 start_codon:yes stop_codon:yes gene_type:complete
MDIVNNYANDCILIDPLQGKIIFAKKGSEKNGQDGSNKKEEIREASSFE